MTHKQRFGLVALACASMFAGCFIYQRFFSPLMLEVPDYFLAAQRAWFMCSGLIVFVIAEWAIDKTREYEERQKRDGLTKEEREARTFARMDADRRES